LSTSGQGACQALEDAWHLAHCLEETPHDLQRAFLKFTELISEKNSGHHYRCTKLCCRVVQSG